MTANAIAIEIRSGILFDPFKGLDDLRNRIIRMVRFDQPAIPIQTGHVLTWRALAWCRIMRFSRILDLNVEPATVSWLRDNEPSEDQRRAFAATFLEPHSVDVQNP
jgi:hypothetical protein